MGKVADHIKKLSKYTVKKQEGDLLKIIGDHDHLLIDIITSQLLNGVDGNGEFLQAYRSKDYAEMKLLLNPKGVTDLKLTGNFWEGFYSIVKKFPIVINSKDEKRGELVKKYGDEIFWPGEDGKELFIQFVEQSFREYYKQLYSTK